MKAQQDPADLDASALSTLYASGSLSPVEALEAVIARIEWLEPTLNTYAALDLDAARRTARESEARWRTGTALSPLDGIPLSIKDLALTRGLPTQRGSLAIPADPGMEDSPIAGSLRDAGATILGKTTASEFGWKGTGDSPATGITRNPWDPERTPGASSAGAAAGVAAGLAVLATGSDGGGSIRIPAAFSGIFGIKPTFGRVPLWPPSFIGSLSHLGPITRSVADAAMMLRVITRPDNRDFQRLPPPEAGWPADLDRGVAGMRIALCFEFPSDPTDSVAVEDGVRAGVQAAADALAAQGAVVELVDAPFENPLPTYRTLFLTYFAHFGRSWSDERLAQLDPGLAEVIVLGRDYDIADYLEAVGARERLCLVMERFHETYDLLLSPTLPVPAFEVGRDAPAEVALRPAWFSWNPFTYPFNLTGQPASSVPCGLSRGLPVGCQLVGKRFAEETVLRASRAIERAMPFARPDLSRLPTAATTTSA